MWSRRRLLAVAASGWIASIAGCLVGRLRGCDESRAAVVETRKADLTDGEPRAGNVVVVADLPDGERRIARSAIDDGAYRVCPVADPTIPEPLRSFAERIADHTNEAGSGVYLAHAGRFYGVGVAIEDQSYATLTPTEAARIGST